MANSREFRDKALQIGAAIRSVREARKIEQAEVGAAYFGAGADAIRKIESGVSGSDGFVKLAKLATILKSSPNELLGFDSEDQGAFRGLLEGMGLAFGLPQEEAVALAGIALGVLASPDIRNSGIPLQDNARNVGKFAIGQFLRGKRPEIS